MPSKTFSNSGTDERRAMANLSIRVEQTVQVTAYCHQRVALGISDLPDDATDDQIEALVSGTLSRGFKHLSKAVREKCDDMRNREIERMNEETKNV